MQELESERKAISLAGILQLISSRKQKKQIRRQLALENSVPKVLDKLAESHLIKEEAIGSYVFETNVSGALVEFFGSGNRTRRGRVGLAKYMANRIKPSILWYSLCHSNSIQLKAVEKLSDYLGKITQRKVSNCEEWYLTKLAKKGCLKRVNAFEFKLIDEKKTFEELISKYKVFIQPEPLLRDFIQLTIEQHEVVTGKMIHDDLEEMRIKHHETSVYKEIKNLLRDNILKDTGKTRKAEGGPGVLKFYEVNFSDPVKYKKEALETIKKTIEHSEFPINEEVWDKFSKFAKDQKPNELDVFLRELRWGFLLRSQDQTASIPLWLSFFSGFKSRELYDQLRAIIPLTTEKKSLVKLLESISREYRVSPLTVVLLYVSIINSPNIA